MKKYFVFLFVIIGVQVNAQLTISSGSHFVSEGAPVIVLENSDIKFNGSFFASNSRFVFSGSGSNGIFGSVIPSLNKVEINKTANAEVILNTTVNLLTDIIFLQGNLELNGYNINMASSALLLNEKESSRIKSATGGEVIITQNLNAPLNSNPGNLGVVITSNSNLGTVTVKRGHLLKTGIGLSSGVSRYYNLIPANNTSLNASLQFSYFDAELNNQLESSLGMFKSADNGTNWTALGFTNRDVQQNHVTKTGLSNLNLFALSSSSSTSLPVTNLQFFAKRINTQSVQLNWQTDQELNNNGFYIERRMETEAQFKVVGFEKSKAIGGNSAFKLMYEKTDANSFAGKTYYRLRQEDLDGKSVYSVIRFVNGSNKKVTVLKAWPIPAINNFYVQVQGIDKQDVLEVFDINGRMMKTFIVNELEPAQISGLTPGTYMIRLASDKNVTQKVIVLQ